MFTECGCAVLLWLLSAHVIQVQQAVGHQGAIHQQGAAWQQLAAQARLPQLQGQRYSRMRLVLKDTAAGLAIP